MHAVDLSGGGEGLVTAAEGDGVHGAQGAQETTEALVAVAAVLGDSPGDGGVGDLHEEGAASADEEDAFTVDATAHRGFGEG